MRRATWPACALRRCEALPGRELAIEVVLPYDATRLAPQAGVVHTAGL